MRKYKFLALALLVSPWISVKAVDSSNPIKKIKKSWAQQVPELLLQDLGEKTLKLAKEGDLEALKSIINRLGKRAFDALLGDPEFIKNLLPYLVFSASNGHTKNVELLLNHNIGRSEQPILGSYFDKKDLDNLLSTKKVQGHEYISDLIKIIQEENNLLRETKDQKPLSTRALEAWKRVLQHKDAHIAPYFVNQLLSDIITLGNKQRYSLVGKMLQNYVDGRNNAPDDSTLQWLLSMPDSEESVAMEVCEKDSFEQWIQSRPRDLNDRYKNFSEQWQRDQWYNSNTFLQALMLEKPAQGETENLYQKVCKKYAEDI